MENPLKDKMHMMMNSDAGFWHKRPLPKEVWEYAALDVLLMLPTFYAIAQKLSPIAKLRLRALTNERINSMYSDDLPPSHGKVKGDQFPLYGISALDSVCYTLLILFFLFIITLFKCFVGVYFFLFILETDIICDSKKSFWKTKKQMTINLFFDCINLF